MSGHDNFYVYNGPQGPVDASENDINPSSVDITDKDVGATVVDTADDDENPRNHVDKLAEIKKNAENGNVIKMDEVVIGISDKNHISNGEVNLDIQAAPEEDNPDTACGYGSFRSKCCQKWNNPKLALLFISLMAMAQGFAVNGVNNSNTSTYERRFKLSSFQVSWISSSADIAGGVSVIFIGYYGQLGHKPRWLAVASLLLGFGCATMSVPHFATGKYEFGEPISDVCPAGNRTCADDGSTTSLQNNLYILILGMIFTGLGGSVLYTLSFTYIDDNVDAVNSPLYVAIFFATTSFGPATGFLSSGAFLTYYVDFDVIDTKTLTINPDDPRWVGAWWIGFVISAILFLIIALVLFAFGRETPNAARIRAERVSQAYRGTDQHIKKVEYNNSLKNLPKVALILLRNPTYLFLTLGSSAQYFVLMAAATFLVKIIQYQMVQSSAFSAILAGIIVVPASFGGQMLSGVIAKCMKLKVRGLIRFIIIAQVLATCATTVLLVWCPAPKMAGINSKYENTSIKLDFGNIEVKSECNKDCGCTLESREPVCGVNNVEYFSPCHAGCRGRNSTTGMYTNCSCIQAASGDLEDSAARGICDGNCTKLPIFLTGMFLLMIFSLMPTTPGISAMLRCTPESTKTFAVGLNWVFIRLLGNIPGPIIFGLLTDNSCILWQDKCGGEKGSCWLYDSNKFSLYLFGATFSINVLGLICFIVALVTYKAPTTDNAPKSEDQTESEKDPEMTSKEYLKNLENVNNSSPFVYLRRIRRVSLRPVL